MILTNCGRCDACKQQKANRVRQRIRNSVYSNEIALFITLTYDNDSIPYVLKNEISNHEGELKIYRNVTYRYFKNRTIRRDFSCGTHSIGTFAMVDEDTGEILSLPLSFYENVYDTRSGTFDKERMGVCFYKDIQDFYKRLRINLTRTYGDSAPEFQFFACSEYGSERKRPHFHSLLIFDKQYFDIFRQAVTQAWPYSDKDRICIEIARDAASYVASYVNCDSLLPEVFTRVFKTKHSFSKFFGLHLDDFRLPALLKKVNRGTLTYRRACNLNGVPAVYDVPVPKYVVSRYFPKIRGIGSLSPDEVRNFLCAPAESLARCSNDVFRTYDDTERHAFLCRIQNAFRKVNQEIGNISWLDYSFLYEKIWNCYESTKYKLQFASTFGPVDTWQLYDNINDYFIGNVRSLSLDSLRRSDVKYEIDPNKFTVNRRMTAYYKDLYARKVKQKRVTNFVMTRGLYIDV